MKKGKQKLYQRDAFDMENTPGRPEFKLEKIFICKIGFCGEPVGTSSVKKEVKSLK